MVCVVLAGLVARVVLRLFVMVVRVGVVLLLIRRIGLRLLIVVRLVGLVVVRVGRLLHLLARVVFCFSGY